MKPVDQTTFGHPGGNCFSACVASLLELQLEQVPYFMAEPVKEWFSRFEHWCETSGMYPMMFDLTSEWVPPGLHILSGQSPRKPDDPEMLHSVVGYHGRIVHDPHPSRDGLLTRRDVIVMVPRDPGMSAEAALRTLLGAHMGVELPADMEIESDVVLLQLLRLRGAGSVQG